MACDPLADLIFAHTTTHAGTAALIGNRCYPLRLKEDAAYPSVVYIAHVSDDNSAYRSQDNVNSQVTRSVSRVQFECYDSTPDGADALATQIIAAWDGYKDECNIGRSFMSNRIDTREDGLKAYRYIVDFMIEHCVTD